jgi:DNA polymerase-3 subunit epsilon
MDFITIDFETATAERDSPCEIGLTFVENFRIVDTKSWLIKPTYYPEFDYYNTMIHGIEPEDVANEPEFDVIWKEIKPLIENKFLIAHNAGFDFSVLRRTLDTYDLEYPTLEYSCSYIFSKKVWEGLPAYDLKTLCLFNNIDFKHHRAAADSRATAELAIKAFLLTGVTSKEDFPEKLRTIVGRLFSGGFKPSETKSKPRDLTNVVGDPQKHNPDSIFYGRKIAFTGTLSSMNRETAQQTIADTGGLLAIGVTKDTDFLIVGHQDYRVVGDEGMSNTQQKAVKSLGKGAQLEIISEIDFLRNL